MPKMSMLNSNIGCFEMNNKIWSADRILWLNSNIGCFEITERIQCPNCI